jgi:hypothetical protein
MIAIKLDEPAGVAGGREGGGGSRHLLVGWGGIPPQGDMPAIRGQDDPALLAGHRLRLNPQLGTR